MHIEECLPSIDEILKLPGRREKTKNEFLDQIDADIKSKNMLHKQEMAMLDMDKERMDSVREERKNRFRENAILRDRLQNELGEVRTKHFFKENLSFLEGIKLGEVTSARHTAFHQSVTKHN